MEDAVADAVRFASELPNSKALPVGVVGYSLGAFAASVEASRNPAIAALVVNSAGLSSFFPADAVRMPPMLIVHAKRDPIVPLAEAETLVERASELGANVTLIVYDSQEHILEGEDWRRLLDEIANFLHVSLPQAR